VTVFNAPVKFPLRVFFAIAYAWTWICWWSVFVISCGKLSLPVSTDTLEIVGQFGPFAAALVVSAATSGRVGLRRLGSSLLRWRVAPVWSLVSLLLLPATMLLAIVLRAAFDRTIDMLRFRDEWTTLPAHFIYLLVLGGPLGEEPGWRGFALPRLQARYGPVLASIWLGLLAAGWHLPLWWIRPKPAPYLLFVVGAVLLTFLFTWLFNHTHGSVLYCLIFHASLSIASVRLPEVPAYHIWVLCLLPIVLLILSFDRSFRVTLHESDNE
jgi:uncharacterized protein